MKCIICKTREIPTFVKQNYQINRCPECDLHRTQLKSSYQKLIKHYYTKAYFTGNQNRAGYANYQEDKKIVQANSQRYLASIHQFVQPHKLLDIGCATGTFISEAVQLGWKCWGIDVSAYATKIAQQKFGKKVKKGIFSSLSFPRQKFTVVTLLDVFEHLGNPRHTLRLIHGYLQPKGLVIINTGDSSSLLAKLEGPKWHYFIPPQHVFFYSRHNIMQLLTSEKFTVLKIYHHGKWLSFRYLLHLMRTINHSRFAALLYRLVHKNFIGKIPLYINLRDNMTIIAQKTN